MATSEPTKRGRPKIRSEEYWRTYYREAQRAWRKKNKAKARKITKAAMRKLRKEKQSLPPAGKEFIAPGRKVVPLK